MREKARVILIGFKLCDEVTSSRLYIRLHGTYKDFMKYNKDVCLCMLRCLYVYILTELYCYKIIILYISAGIVKNEYKYMYFPTWVRALLMRPLYFEIWLFICESW